MLVDGLAVGVAVTGAAIWVPPADTFAVTVDARFHIAMSSGTSTRSVLVAVAEEQTVLSQTCAVADVGIPEPTTTA
ncbi:hypothetical protein AZH51_15565 [Branchiibius sp. NY16-3462-2]|nr:hypothetical protein AZH51_15565 [Branchiibius sp. NY16-3462-2]